jgi:hypothetical protein
MPDTPPPSPPREKRLKPKPSPEELARDAIAHEKIVVGGNVRMTFRVVLSRHNAQALAAQAIREEKNLEALVTEILEAAAKDGKSAQAATRDPVPLKPSDGA